MNKTVNINLGGSFFHIDEDAYQKLSRYFEAIKRSLNNSTGQDEIIKDIEMRIAEIISEKHTHDKQVINSREVDEVIAIMGQPEDYRLEDEGQPQNASGSFDYAAPRQMKKLYRDTEKGMISGVATGLGHYFGIDSVWIKILFLIFVFFGFGTGIVAYFVLWIVTPAALTTAEKLEMRGEAVNISNIEKKVREEFENVSSKIKGANYGEVKTGAERAANTILDALGKVFKAFAKVLGALIVVFSALALISMFLGLFTLGTGTFMDLPWQRYTDALNYTDLPLWAVATLGFVSVAVPVFFLFILGLKLLVSNLKSIGSVAKYTLLALWLLSLGILIAIGIKQATEIGYDGKTVVKQQIAIAQGDTLRIKFRYNDYYAKNVHSREDFLFVQDEKGKDLIYSNNVHIEILPTDAALPYIQIEKVARGKSLSEARQRSEKIKYGFAIEGNQLILDNYLLTEAENKFRKQEVEIFLYVPVGIYLKPDSSIQQFDWSDDWYFNLHWSGDYDYEVFKDRIRCVTCPPEEADEEGDMDDMADKDEGIFKGKGVYIETTPDSAKTITIDKNGVRVQNGSKTETGKLKSLKVNENGVIIKTE